MGDNICTDFNLWHILIVNVYDIETYTNDEKVIPYCVCAIVCNVSIIIYYENNVDILLKSFSEIARVSLYNEIEIYVHNINFDGMLLLETLFVNNIVFNLIKRDLNIFAIMFSYLGCNFKFKCSYKLIPLSLSYLGDLVGLNKTKFPYKFSSYNNLFYIGECPNLSYFNDKISYESFNKKSEFDFKKESIDYCLNDVVILKKVLDDVIMCFKNFKKKIMPMFDRSYSIPSFSHKIFYKYYNVMKIDKKISLEMHTYIKNSYYGGRCEIFGNANDDEITHYFDYSGMYGQCMQQKFPYGKARLYMDHLDISKIGFHYIKFKSDMHMPVLPVHYNGKLMFGNGVLEGLYWYEEIMLFVEMGGCVIEIKYSIIYESEDYVFTKFVEDFSELRNEGGYKKIIGKLIINSLYGSFGMKEDLYFTTITFSEKEFNDIIEHTNVKSYCKLNNCYMIDIYKDHLSSRLYNKFDKMWDTAYHTRNIAYASIISAKARCKLYNAFLNVMNDGGRLLYCDTDSIFAAYKINKRNDSCADVTWLETYDDSCFILPKFYALKSSTNVIIKTKGVSNHEFEYDYIVNKFYNNDKLILNETVFNRCNYKLKNFTIEKNIWLGIYNKRIFSLDKKYTTPVYINLDDKEKIITHTNKNEAE